MPDRTREESPGDEREEASREVRLNNPGRTPAAAEGEPDGIPARVRRRNRIVTPVSACRARMVQLCEPN